MEDQAEQRESSDLDNAVQQISLGSGHGHKLFHLPENLVPYKPTVFAYIASTCGLLVGYPFDSIKTRQQTYRFKNATQCAIETFRTEGIRGFYRGVLAPIVSSACMRSFNMTIYLKSASSWSEAWRNVYRPANKSDNLLSTVLRNSPVTFCAGATAGISTTVFGTPFEFVKIVCQIEMLAQRRLQEADPGRVKSLKPIGTWAVAKNLVQRNGPGVLYAGWKMQIMRDMIGSGIYFCTYDNLKRILSKFMGKDNSSLAIALAGAVAGTSCWMVVYPLDSYKTHYQRDVYTRQFQTHADGTPKRFKMPSFWSLIGVNMYRGLGTSILRTSLVGIVFFSVYEHLMGIC